MARLAPGSVDQLEEGLLEATNDRLAMGELTVNATQHAPGNTGIGVESVIVEVTADVDDALKEPVLDAAYETFVGGSENLISQTIQHSHERLRRYGSQHSYDVESIVDSFAGVEVRRAAGTLTIGYGWDHPAAGYFERGTSDHTIHGKPVLSFVWEDPPSWVREEFEQARGEGGQFASGWRVFFQNVDVQGIPESRYVRAGVRFLEREVGSI